MAGHHEHDHRCSEVVAADQATARRRSSVSSFVARLNSPSSPSATRSHNRKNSWNFGHSDAAQSSPASQANPGQLPLQRRTTLEADEALIESPEESPCTSLPSRTSSETNHRTHPTTRKRPTVLVPPQTKELEHIPLERKSTWTQAEQEAGDGFVPKCKWYFRTFTWGRWLAEDVSSKGLVPALVIQALATGILDATTYADFATFASNQTGNCIVLTLAAIRLHKNQVLMTGVSFGAFLTGAFIFGQLGHFVGVRRRGWLLFNQLFQTMELVVAGVLMSPAGPASTAVGGKQDWAVILLFAAMSGQQVAMARQSSCAELPTAPMTSAFVDFVADHYLFASWGDPRATPRNRRVYYVVTMIGGSFIGAALHKYTSSWPVVVLTLLLKMVAWVCIAIAKPD